MAFGRSVLPARSLRSLPFPPRPPTSTVPFAALTRRSRAFAGGSTVRAAYRLSRAVSTVRSRLLSGGTPLVTAGRGVAGSRLGPRPGAFLIAYRQVDPEVVKSGVSSRFRHVTTRDGTRDEVRYRLRNAIPHGMKRNGIPGILFRSVAGCGFRCGISCAISCAIPFRCVSIRFQVVADG